MSVLIISIGKLPQDRCFKCGEPFYPQGDDDLWRMFQEVRRSRRGNCYCSNCYRWDKDYRVAQRKEGEGDGVELLDTNG